MVNRWNDDVVTCNEGWVGEQSLYVYKAIERERLSVFGGPQSSSWFYARERKKEYKKSMGIVLVELYICLQTVGSDTGLFSLLYRFRLHVGCNGERGSSLGPSLWMTNHCPCACAAHIRDVDESSRFLVVCNWKPSKHHRNNNSKENKSQISSSYNRQTT